MRNANKKILKKKNLSNMSKEHTRNTVTKGSKKILYLRTENLKNHTLFRGTYLYCPYMGGPLPPTPRPGEDTTPGMEGQIKEWLENYRPVSQRKVRRETTKDKPGALPPAVYAVHQTVNEPKERLRFPEENNVSSAIAVPQRVVSIQFVDGGKGMLLRCLRITEKNKLMSMRQIRMTKNQILKNSQSLSRERVL